MEPQALRGQHEGRNCALSDTEDEISSKLKTWSCNSRDLCETGSTDCILLCRSLLDGEMIFIERGPSSGFHVNIPKCKKKIFMVI